MAKQNTATMAHNNQALAAKFLFNLETQTHRLCGGLGVLPDHDYLRDTVPSVYSRRYPVLNGLRVTGAALMGASALYCGVFCDVVGGNSVKCTLDMMGAALLILPTIDIVRGRRLQRAVPSTQRIIGNDI